MTNSVSARLERVKEQIKLIGWHGNKQAWCRGLVFASPAPFLKILVRSEADPHNPAGRLAPQGVERPVHAGVQ
jgi:hypothetical protein